MIVFATTRMAGDVADVGRVLTAAGNTYEDCMAAVSAQITDGHEIVSLEVIGD